MRGFPNWSSALLLSQSNRACFVLHGLSLELDCGDGKLCFASNALYQFSKASRKSQLLGVFASQSVEENHALPTMSHERKDMYTKLQASRSKDESEFQSHLRCSNQTFSSLMKLSLLKFNKFNVFLEITMAYEGSLERPSLLTVCLASKICGSILDTFMVCTRVLQPPGVYCEECLSLLNHFCC